MTNWQVIKRIKDEYLDYLSRTHSKPDSAQDKESYLAFLAGIVTAGVMNEGKEPMDLQQARLCAERCQREIEKVEAKK